MTLVSPTFFLKKRTYLLSFSIKKTAIYTSPPPPPLTYINIISFFYSNKNKLLISGNNPGMRRTYIARMKINGH